MEKPDFQVKDIATHDPMKLKTTDNVGEVLSEIREVEFTILPTEDGYGEAVGYVRKEELEKADESENIRGLQTEIKADNILPPYVGFKKTLHSLYRNFFYFIGGKTGVDAIVTRSDLNTKPSRSYLFRRFLDFETSMEQYINSIDEWENMIPGDIKKVNSRYEQAKEDDIQLAKISYAQFGTKMNIITYDDNIPQVNEEISDKIIKLKRDVSEGNPVIRNISGRGEDRGIGELMEMVDQLDEIQNKLDDKIN